MAEKNMAQVQDAPPMSEALRTELEQLTNIQRAAVLMLLLGEQEAANIIQYLDPKEVQPLGAAMVSVADISQEAINTVLDEFLGTIKNQTYLGLGVHDYVETVLKRALGDDKAASVLGRIMPGSSSKGLEILRWMDSRAISDMIRSEHPQVISIILSVLEADVAAEVLNYLPAEQRPEVVQRIATLDAVTPAAMLELEAVMKKQFSSSSSSASSTLGGVKVAAKILNFTKTTPLAGIISSVTKMDLDLAQKIQDNMFVFDNLSGCDNRSIQVIMRAVEPDLLMVGLKGADEAVRSKFFDNMSTRARSMFIDDMEAKGPMRLSDVQEAQKQIVRIARKLADTGEIMLAGGGDDFV
jgi:flagellar motor switch protein FliG